ncbi:methionine synthase, partial [Halobium palmae]
MTDRTDRILTTHIGSLPRSPELLDLLMKREAGESVDEAEWDETARAATETVIRRQAEAGLDIVNNGEQPRVSFNWYVKNRLGGIGGNRDAPLWDDLRDYRDYAEDAFASDIIDLTTQPAVVEPISYTGREAAEAEISTFYELLDESDEEFEGTFLTAASPGTAAATLVNEAYDSHREFVFAIADALREEYELVADSGAVLQLDAPELLASGHRA